MFPVNATYLASADKQTASLLLVFLIKQFVANNL